MTEISFSVESVDYNTLIDKLLPLYLENMSASGEAGFWLHTLKKFDNLTTGALKAAVSVMPQNAREELLANCLQHYKASLKDYLNKLAADNGIALNIADINIEKRD